MGAREAARTLPDLEVLPQHVVIIPDGNRRWAAQRGLPAEYGHRRGAEVALDLLWQCKDWGIPVLTFWAFSTDNWNRNPAEVNSLLEMLTEFLRSNISQLRENRVRFRHLGRKDRIPNALAIALQEAEHETCSFSDYAFNLALDYGGQDEILRAIRGIVDLNIQSEHINSDTVRAFLDTKDIPDPDLIIRTSGETRLSGIMPYQSIHSELLFLNVHFPDLSSSVLRGALEEFARRRRSYGK